MSLETFKTIFHKLPRTVTQIAFGIGDLDANPDLFKILTYCRDNNYQEIIPNITINGAFLTDENARRLADILGAIAISNHDQNICFSAVERMFLAGDRPGATLAQINIHQILCQESYQSCLDLMDQIKVDKRLENLNAVVFLLLKPKGKRNKCTQLKDPELYAALIHKALDQEIPFGFDSCSANNFSKVIKRHRKWSQLLQCVEPCESTCFSLYVDVKGNAYPCSFCPDSLDFKPISLLKIEDFDKEVWHAPQVEAFREGLLKNGGSCPVFNLEI